MKSKAEKLLPPKFQSQLERILATHNGYRAGREKARCSVATRHDRGNIIKLAFAQLWQMGYQLDTPRGLGGRHVQALMKRWDEEGIAVITMHNRLSSLRTFAGWIGKQGMVLDIGEYLPNRDLRRTTVAKRNRAWLPNGVDPQDIIARARDLNERLALILSLQDAFGLRVKEAIEMRPAFCLVESGKAIEIYEGTKGGRLRRIDIDTDRKCQVFEWARQVAAANRNGRVRWPEYTWRQAQRRYYHLLSKLGVTRCDLGVTSHGLRHGYSQEKYEDLTGLPPPISGVDPKLVDPDVHRDAGIQVSRDLGHGRLQVTASYYGSHGHALRKGKGKQEAHPINSGQGEAK